MENYSRLDSEPQPSSNKMSGHPLVFTAKDIPYRGKGLTFDDVICIPQHGNISSRGLPSLSTQLTRQYTLPTPFISSNMDTITEAPMCLAMAREGGIGILHRFISIEEQLKQIEWLKNELRQLPLFPGTAKHLMAASIGVKQEGKDRAIELAKVGVDILTIDIAHGDSELMWDTLSFVKEKFPHIQVIAGNVATPWAVTELCKRGADAIKVGIGPGSMCTTRVVTGHGVPQLTAIAWCAKAAEPFGVPIIADGGLRSSGDIVKAISAGASSVMLGSLLAGTLETPGEVKGGMKKYRGMASKDAQVSWRGELPAGLAAEGVDTFVSCKGSVSDVLSELSGGLRSGMTYASALNFQGLKENAWFMEMSPFGLQESRPHGKLS